MTFPNTTYADHKYSLLSWSRLPLPLFVLASAPVIAPLVELGWGAGHVSSRRKSVAERERGSRKGKGLGGKHPPTHHRQMVGDGQFILLVSKSGLAGPRAQKKAVLRIWFGNNTQGVKFL